MNKRYKLLRDLPNAKAGETFKRDNYGDLIFEDQDSIASRGVIAFTDGEIKQFGILNHDKGWFEEVKEDGYWYIGTDGTPITRGFALSAKNSTDEAREAIGNYFKTKEEAEAAVKKLEAWKRLKDAGFKFINWYGGSKTITYEFKDKPEGYISVEECADLGLLFGGEE